MTKLIYGSITLVVVVSKINTIGDKFSKFNRLPTSQAGRRGFDPRLQLFEKTRLTGRPLRIRCSFRAPFPDLSASPSNFDHLNGLEVLQPKGVAVIATALVDSRQALQSRISTL